MGGGSVLMSITPPPGDLAEQLPARFPRTQASCQTVPKKENSPLFQRPPGRGGRAAVPPSAAGGAAGPQPGLRGLLIFLSENGIPQPLHSVRDSLGAASGTHCQTTPNDYNRDQKRFFSTSRHGVRRRPVDRRYS